MGFVDSQQVDGVRPSAQSRESRKSHHGMGLTGKYPYIFQLAPTALPVGQATELVLPRFDIGFAIGLAR